MGTRMRIDVMIRVPEQATIEGSSIFIGVIDVDVHYMPRKRIEQVEPLEIASCCQLQEATEDHVKLIVVMRHDRVRTRIVRLFVIRRNVAEVSPAVFVD